MGWSDGASLSCRNPLVRLKSVHGLCSSEHDRGGSSLEFHVDMGVSVFQGLPEA